MISTLMIVSRFCMMLFMNIDKAVGKDFEEGLAELKRTLEA